jgi:DHA1 family tetracycline resistance protein-like MFS transporter
MAGIFGPFLFTQLFAAAIRHPQAWHMPGVAFYLAATLLALALLLAFRHAR